LIASGAVDGFVRIWDAETRDLIQTIPFGGAVLLVEFLNDDHLLVFSRSHPALVVTIDVPELIETAHSKVTRSFTEGECTTYHIDPCPTLEELKSGSAYRLPPQGVNATLWREL
jgi:WD40 repeat protein